MSVMYKVGDFALAYPVRVEERHVEQLVESIRAIPHVGNFRYGRTPDAGWYWLSITGGTRGAVPEDAIPGVDGNIQYGAAVEGDSIADLYELLVQALPKLWTALPTHMA